MVLVYVDHESGRLDDLSLQAVTFAHAVAAETKEQLHAVLVGQVSDEAAASLGSYGVRTVSVMAHPEIRGFAPRAVARALAEALDSMGGSAVVAVGSDRGNEVLAHLAAITDQPFAADCLEISLGEPTSVTRSRWGGSLLEEAEVHGSPVLCTVAPHSTAAAVVGDTSAEVRHLSPDLKESDLVVQATQEAVGEAEGVTLSDAKVVVSGGRGVGGSEGFAVLEELADLLGGAVGCSRVVTSAGWRPHTDQVGQTGTKVAPDLYIACGISGATQHLAGCRTSKTMLVINNDPEASILAHADYAVIGDLHKILPAIVAETRNATST